MEQAVTLPEWEVVWYPNMIGWQWRTRGPWLYSVAAFREDKEIKQPYAEAVVSRVNLETGVHETLWLESWCRSCYDPDERAFVRAEELRCLSAEKILAMSKTLTIRFHQCCEACEKTGWIEVPLDSDWDVHDRAASLCEACRALDD